MNIMRDKKRKNDPGTDTGPRKHKTPSPVSSLIPSSSASTVPFRGSLFTTNLSRPSRSPSSLLPASSANSVGPLSSSVLQSRMSAGSMANTAGSGLRRRTSSTVKQRPVPNNGFSYQAEANVDSPFLASDSSYNQTFRASPSPLGYNFFPGLSSPHNFHAQGEAIKHFQLDHIAPDVQNDLTAALPVGWTSRDSTMIDPALCQAQYSMIDFDNGSANSTGIALPQPPPSVPSYPAPCWLCNPPQEIFEIQGGKIFKTSEEFEAHLWEVHKNSFDWRERECLFAQCSSHAKHITFSNVKRWLSHVHTVHYPSFYCPQPGCKFRFGGPSKPFGSQSDLNRHILTHGPPVYCEKPGCTGKDNLARKDKYKKHQVEYHGTFRCLQPDCPRARHVNGVSYGYSSAKELEKHERISHGEREIVSGYDATAQVI